MGRFLPWLTIFVLLCSSFSSGQDPPSLVDQIREIQQQMEELFETRNKRLEQITLENHLLRQTVEQLSWEVGSLEQSMKRVENGHDAAMWNISHVFEQFDNTMAHQQYCASDNASGDLLDDYYLTCGSFPPSTTQSPAPSPTTTEGLPPQTTEEPSPNVYRSCGDAPPWSGVYEIVLPSGREIQAFCEQDHPVYGGGWLVFQSRMDGTVDFNRNWSDYRDGFGSAAREYWLGLESLVELTGGGGEWAELLIDMEDFEQVKQYARYPHFAVEDSSTDYRLRLSGAFEGTAGDSLGYYYNERFSTYDSDRLTVHGGCAETLASGFWHYSCGDSLNKNNLNGVYGFGHDQKGIWWGTFGGATAQNRKPLKTVRMMIRNSVV